MRFFGSKRKLIENRDLIDRSGLFDREWYLNRYPDVRQSGMDPLAHFVKFGMMEHRNPNAYFDSDWYLAFHRDVAAAGLAPFEHYVRFGASETRAPSPLFDAHWYENEALPGLRKHNLYALQHYLAFGRDEGVLVKSIQSGYHATRHMGSEGPLFHRSMKEGPTIAVVAHVYYGDLAPEICSYLRNIPYRFNAFFTVPEEAVIPEVQAAIELYRLDCVAEFRVSQNRGRNFGPFLVEFRQKILEHDLFVHLHTKKSLRTGDNQFRWRKHLYEGLLGSEAVTSAILGRFASDPTVGMVFPSTFPEFGPWFHNWLGSSHRGAQLFAKLGIPEYHFRGLIDMPVGGMFWARSAALRSLLEYPWSYEEFDPEPSHHDGTLAHGIERGICDIAVFHGYNHLEFDYYHGTLRQNWNEKLLHQYLNTPDIAKHMINGAEVVSFDFYDTLACRLATTPDDVHNYIGWALEHRNLIPRERDFFSTRKAAEAHARGIATKGDVDIHDIYQSFAACCDWSEEAIAAAKDFELSIEERCLLPRRDVVAMLRQAHSSGKRTILVSDSYMPKDFFERVLSRLGILNYIDHLYISADCGYRKDRDDLWAMLQNSEVKDKKFVHFGDNEESDIHLPVVRGIPCLHLLNTTVLADLRGLHPPGNWRKQKTDWRDGLLLGPVIAKTSSNAFLSHQSFRPITLSNAHDAGYAIFGPIFFGFLTWIINHAAAKELPKLAFLAREGHFLHENYEYLRRLLGKDGLDLPASHYFPMSRRLALGAMQSSAFDPEFVVRGANFSGTIGDFLLARLGFEVRPDFGLAKAKISTVHDREFILDVLKILEPQIKDAASEKRNRLLQYCEENSLMSTQLGLVDLGYSGSIQSALQEILPASLRGFYMVTSPDIIDVFKRGGTAFGYFSEANRDADSAVKNFSLILEALLTAPHGQVIDFTLADGGMVPVHKKKGKSQADFSYLKAINEGAKEYMRDLVVTYGPEIAFTAFPSHTSELPLRYLVQRHLREPNEFWEKLHVEDDFCGNDEIHVKGIYRFDQ